MGDREEEGKKRFVINSTTVGMAQARLNQIHGEAASQIVQAYKGVRYDSTGKVLYHKGKSLKEISKFKLSTEYREQNIKQQSGFSGELIKEARDNKKAILSGDGTRTRTSDGIGHTNDTKYDHVKLSAEGKVIDGSGSQMKMLKGDNNKYNVLEKLANDKSWDRYDGPVDVPNEQYDGILKSADAQVQKHRDNAQRAREKGNTEAAQKELEKAKRYEDAKKRIRKADVSTEDAIVARKNPELFVAKEVMKDANHAGINAAKSATILSGAISTSQNMYQVLYCNKTIDEAAKDVALTTAKSGVVAYGVGASGTLIKVAMHSSKKEIMRRVGNTNAPTLIAVGIIEVSNSMKRYGNGEIDEVELLQELGEKGTGMVAAGFGGSVGAVVGGALGTIILPGVGTAFGATVGGFIGSTVGYGMSSILYRGALDALEDEKISAERRAIIEQLSEKCVQEISTYRTELTAYAERIGNEKTEKINTLFENIHDSIFENNMNGFFASMNQLGNVFGVELQFNTFEEFDEFMLEEDTVLRF